MARPMILMQEDKLVELYDKFAIGVPVLSIMRQYKLDNVTTPPTLTKLLKHYKAYRLSEDIIVKAIIYNSLFPSWLREATKLTVTTPKEWYYQGKMPLGTWKLRTAIVEPTKKK